MSPARQEIPPPPHTLFIRKGDGEVDAYDWSTGIYAAAVAMARCMTTEELSRAAVLLTQLGTTLGTLAALRQLEEGETAL